MIHVLYYDPYRYVLREHMSFLQANIILYIMYQIICYFNMYHRRAGSFREVYISRSSRFDRIRESLSREIVNIAIQTHNTSTQIAKLIQQKCLFEREIAKFYAVNCFRSTACSKIQFLHSALCIRVFYPLRHWAEISSAT